MSRQEAWAIFLNTLLLRWPSRAAQNGSDGYAYITFVERASAEIAVAICKEQGQRVWQVRSSRQVDDGTLSPPSKRKDSCRALRTRASTIALPRIGRNRVLPPPRSPMKTSYVTVSFHCSTDDTLLPPQIITEAEARYEAWLLDDHVLTDNLRNIVDEPILEWEATGRPGTRPLPF